MHSNNENDEDNESNSGSWQQKPLPLQRILLENSGVVMRNGGGNYSSRLSPPSPKDISMAADKENRPNGSSLKLPEQNRCGCVKIKDAPDEYTAV
jgi:hypothetical protein